MHRVIFQPSGISVAVEHGSTVLGAQRSAGLLFDAPCGGMGICGKCLVEIDGEQVQACRTSVDTDLIVNIKHNSRMQVSTSSSNRTVDIMPTHGYAAAVDIGTTTIVAYLLDRANGQTLAVSSRLNPQTQYGSDVISRMNYALKHGTEELQKCLLSSVNIMLSSLANEVGISTVDINIATVAGNTFIHHILLGLPLVHLAAAPYKPFTTDALEVSARELLNIGGVVRVLPVLGGYVGADTAAVLLSAQLDSIAEPTLVVDIGTNAEIMLGDGKRLVVCSAAAGPAFEGASISCGVRGTVGAIDHVSLEDAALQFTTIGGEKPCGICGSGLVDLVACLLETGEIDSSGKLENETFHLVDGVALTRRDVREVQLAKAAIAASIRVAARHMGVELASIKNVMLAGAFGNYVNPVSARRIGLLPSELTKNVVSIGNAAGDGAIRAALSDSEWDRVRTIAAKTEHIELAADADFQDIFVDEMPFQAE